MTTIKDNVNKLFLEILQGEELTDKKTILEVLNTYCEKNSIYPTETKEKAKTIREALEDIINGNVLFSTGCSAEELRNILLEHAYSNITYGGQWASRASVENASTGQLLSALSTPVTMNSDISKFEETSLYEALIEVLKEDVWSKLYFDENGYLIKKIDRPQTRRPIGIETLPIWYSPNYPQGYCEPLNKLILDNISYYMCGYDSTSHILTAYKVVNATSDTPMHLEKVRLKIEMRLKYDETIPTTSNKSYIDYLICEAYVLFYNGDEPQEAQLLSGATLGEIYMSHNITPANKDFACSCYLRGSSTQWNLIDFFYKKSMDNFPITLNQGDVVAYITFSGIGQQMRPDFISDAPEEESV